MARVSSLDYFGSTIFADGAILGTHFHSILGAGLFFGLVIFWSSRAAFVPLSWWSNNFFDFLRFLLPRLFLTNATMRRNIFNFDHIAYLKAWLILVKDQLGDQRGGE
jgi:hypothetical protein